MANLDGMKVVALVVGLLVGGYFIDSYLYHGYYFRAFKSFVQQITTYNVPRR